MTQYVTVTVGTTDTLWTRVILGIYYLPNKFAFMVVQGSSINSETLNVIETKLDECPYKTYDLLCGLEIKDGYHSMTKVKQNPSYGKIVLKSLSTLKKKTWLTCSLYC